MVAPIVAIMAGLAAVIPSAVLERLIEASTLSIFAFIVWPIIAYCMFIFLPK